MAGPQFKPISTGGWKLTYTFVNHEDEDKLYYRHVMLDSEALSSWPKDFTGMKLKFAMPKEDDKKDLSAKLTCKDRDCGTFTSILTLSEGDMAGTAKVNQTRYEAVGGSTLNWFLGANENEGARKLEKLLSPLKDVLAPPALAEYGIETQLDIKSVEGGASFFKITRSYDFGTDAVELRDGSKVVVIGAKASGKLDVDDSIGVSEWTVLEGRTTSIGASSMIKGKATFRMSGLFPADKNPVENDPSLLIEPTGGGTAGMSLKK